MEESDSHPCKARSSHEELRFQQNPESGAGAGISRSIGLGAEPPGRGAQPPGASRGRRPRRQHLAGGALSPIDPLDPCPCVYVPFRTEIHVQDAEKELAKNPISD